MHVKELFAYLTVADANAAIDFYTGVFGATELYRLTDPQGRVGHAELDVGGSRLMLADEFPDMGTRGPKSVGGTSVTIHLHVDDADEVIRGAAAAGAVVERGPEDKFYGERSGTFIDPFGHRWNIGHEIEAVTPEEMQKRYASLVGEK